jgi:hypothetical protein
VPIRSNGLDRGNRGADTVSPAQSISESARGVAHIRIRRHRDQSRSQARCGQRAPGNCLWADPDRRDTISPVKLIQKVRDNKLWNTCARGSRRGAGATVMYDPSQPWE